MNQTLNDLRFELFLNRGLPAQSTAQPSPTVRRLLDPRETAPVTADGYVWLFQLWWKQWQARRHQPSAVDASIQEQAVERRFNQLSAGL